MSPVLRSQFIVCLPLNEPNIESNDSDGNEDVALTKSRREEETRLALSAGTRIKSGAKKCDSRKNLKE